MDGNGRWAQARNLPRTEGHKQGANAIKTTVKEAIHLNISYLTLFGFSVENWNRPEIEIRELMGLLKLYLKKNVNELENEGVCLRVIGNLSRLPTETVEMIQDAEVRTKSNKKLILTIALSYGSRQEIIMATKKIVNEVMNGQKKPENINEEYFSQKLFTNDLPDPDLLIRTSGEQRLSNFLLWQIAYAELVFTKTQWPDFSSDCFNNAIKEYRNRDRRYGIVSS
jgi:undecaprenyl diphosphate synthase